MDFNLVVVAGMLAAPPEVTGESGRVLVTVRSQPQGRVDLIGVTVPDGAQVAGLASGDRLWVSGGLQRRFSALTGRSRLEVVGRHVALQQPEC